MKTLILVARPSEMSTLIQWVCQEYYPDTPTDCPSIKDTIRQRIGTLLQTYFVRDRRECDSDLDIVLEAVMAEIEQELESTVTALTKKGFQINAVDTFAVDGSTRFLLTMIGDHHEQPLPETDTG